MCAFAHACLGGPETRFPAYCTVLQNLSRDILGSRRRLADITESGLKEGHSVSCQVRRVRPHRRRWRNRLTAPNVIAPTRYYVAETSAADIPAHVIPRLRGSVLRRRFSRPRLPEVRGRSSRCPCYTVSVDASSAVFNVAADVEMRLPGPDIIRQAFLRYLEACYRLCTSRVQLSSRRSR